MGLDKEERENFMREIGLNKTGLNKLIREGYDLLNLDTYFTSGPEESRAWTVKKNTLAPQAAGVIHTDFEKNFIRAEAVSCEDFIKYGSFEKCKENGKLRIEGKDYVVKDGAVVIIDEFTGRMMPGRRWSDGLHQAIEAKEKVKIQRESKTLAGITFQNYLVDAKMQIVKKLNSVKGLTNTFIKTANGFKVTNPEGYVAIDRVSGGAVKLVDRMEFSFNNFTAIKAWDK